MKLRRHLLSLLAVAAGLGAFTAPAVAAEVIRQRDNERLSEQVQGDFMSGRDRLLLQPIPEPLAGSSVSQQPSD